MGVFNDNHPFRNTQSMRFPTISDVTRSTGFVTPSGNLSHLGHHVGKDNRLLCDKYRATNVRRRSTKYAYDTHESRPPCIPQQMSMSECAFSKVRNAAQIAGYSLRNKSVGPLISISIEEGKEECKTERAKINGALLPNGRLHIESYKAFSPGLSSYLLSVTPAIFVFIGALAHASDRKCHTVTGLAINDDAKQHRRLLAYLRRYGGHPKYVVDDSVSKLPARILYGGFGTVVEGDVKQMLRRGMAMIDRQSFEHAD